MQVKLYSMLFIRNNVSKSWVRLWVYQHRQETIQAVNITNKHAHIAVERNFNNFITGIKWTTQPQTSKIDQKCISFAQYQCSIATIFLLHLCLCHHRLSNVAKSSLTRTLYYLAQCAENIIVLSSPSSQDEGATKLPALKSGTCMKTYHKIA